MKIPTYKPRCPYCHAILEDVGFPLPKKGKGLCPSAGGYYQFEAEVDEDQVVKDKDGRPQKAIGWKVTGPKH